MRSAEPEGLLAEGLGLKRGARWVFRGVDVALPAARALALTGPNGSGKSSLLRAVAGLLPIAEGRVRACALAYLGHQDGLQADLTVRENLLLARRMAGRATDAAARRALDESLERAGLSERADLPLRRLSQGQRRRVALTRMTLVGRPLWLLDEPDAALDSSAESWFDGLLDAHLRAGGAALIATHRALRLPAHVMSTLALLGAPTSRHDDALLA